MMSNEPTIAEMNYAIGIFAGKSFAGSHITDYTAKNAPDMRYHTSWDWLMPVVEMIEAMDNRRYGFVIEPTSVIVSDLDRKEGDEQIIWVHEYPDNGDTKISMVYDAVYQFITWYSQQKQTNGQQEAKDI